MAKNGKPPIAELRRVMAYLGRIGGSRSTPAKRAAARRNGLRRRKALAESA